MALQAASLRLLARFLLSLLICMLTQLAAARSQNSITPMDEAASREMAARVKAELLHAWHGYERYAWGHDELRPLSKKPRDWYGESLLMTPVDALDTLLLMGLDVEANKARQLIDTQLSFDRNIEVKVFEVTIRLLGGLLSAYEITGDARLLALAHDLGRRLLPAFDSPTGLPYQLVNLRTGRVSGRETNPAESGTLLLEFGTLSNLTGEPIFRDRAKRALSETYHRRSQIGLVGEGINVESGDWTSSDSHIGGGIDSFYEYQWKCWKLFDDPECLQMWNSSLAAIERYLADDSNGQLWYGHADMRSGQRTATVYGALEAFFPALLAFSGHIVQARRLQQSSLRMWNIKGVEPELFDYRRGTIVDPHYALRPEIVESTYYLYRLTGDRSYRQEGRALFEDFVKACRTEAGYAALASVTTRTAADSMESFLFAETFKYFYLLFAPPQALDFQHVVFNTEAHPLRRQSP